MKTRIELQQENTTIRSLLLEKDDVIQSINSQLESQSLQIKARDAIIEQLTEALILARQRQFAKTSESLHSTQYELFDEVELLSEAPDDEVVEPRVTISSYTRKGRSRKPLPKDFPRIEKIYDLPDDEKVCSMGHALKPMGEKVTEQLDIIPMQVHVIRHVRKQYHCPCCEGVIKIASKPKQAIEKSQASAGLLSYIAVSKYADSLPLYRQSQILKRFDIEMSRTTLANWMIKCGQLIQPLINRLEEQLLSESFVHMDETPVQVLNEAGKSAESKSYMWVRCAGPPGSKIILFDYDPSRSGCVPARLLQDYQGALMVDGYEGYSLVCRTQTITRLGCWVHARRKFIEANKVSKKKGVGDYAVKQIAKLYQIEKRYNASSAEDRYQARQQQSKAIIEQLKHWSEEITPKVPPKSALGKALHYLNHQWSRLIGYLDNGHYPIDNNPVENAIRPFTLGRKNWLFSSSVRGVKASANLYSLIETAKANDLEPYRYLKHVFTQLPNAQNYDDIDLLLPSNVKNAL